MLKWVCGKEFYSHFWELQTCKATLKINAENSQERKIDLPHYPGIPLLEICQKEKISYSKYICSTMFTVALFTIAKTGKQP